MIYRSRILNISLYFYYSLRLSFATISVFQSLEIAGRQRWLAGLSYEPQIELAVMNRGYLHGHQLIGNKKDDAHKPSVYTRSTYTTDRPGHRGWKSSAHLALRIFIVPSGVNSVPLRPLRVGASRNPSYQRRGQLASRIFTGGTHPMR